MLSKPSPALLFLIITLAILVACASTTTLVSNDVNQSEEPAANVGQVLATTTGPRGPAKLKKNRVRGPADMGLYFVNNPGNCGGMSVTVCSKDCGALGYPVYWCYAKLCYCHFG